MGPRGTRDAMRKEWQKDDGLLPMWKARTFCEGLKGDEPLGTKGPQRRHTLMQMKVAYQNVGKGLVVTQEILTWGVQEGIEVVMIGEMWEGK